MVGPPDAIPEPFSRGVPAGALCAVCAQAWLAGPELVSKLCPGLLVSSMLARSYYACEPFSAREIHMPRADFNRVHINHMFNIANPSVSKAFPIEGTDTPIDDGYVLIQAIGVDAWGHRISINGNPLPHTDIPPGNGWRAWVDHIPPGYLKAGTNTIQIERTGNDDFTIHNVFIHWREHG